jgi:hypothetical protein
MLAGKKTPIDFMLDALDWKATGTEPTPGSSLPYVTHSGVLAIGAASMRCYRLSTGEAVFDADDFEDFMEALLA